MDIETAIVIVIVAAAFIIAARSIYKKITGKSRCNCGCCSASCGMNKECNIGKKGR